MITSEGCKVLFKKWTFGEDLSEQEISDVKKYAEMSDNTLAVNFLRSIEFWSNGQKTTVIG